jgi:hypothetical protein
MSEGRSLVSGDQYLAGLLIFFWRAVRKQLVLIFILPLVVMAIAFFAASQLTPIYAAQSSLRIGRVDGTEAISSKAAAARINSSSFKERVVRSMDLSAAGDRRAAQLVFDSLTARPEETGDSLVVSVRGFSEDRLRQTLEAVMRLLNDEQEKIQAPLVANIRAQLSALDASIANLSATQRSLSDLVKASIPGATPDAQSSDSASQALLRSVLLADLVSRNEQRLVTAKAERYALETRINPWKTYPTSFVDDIFAPRTPVSPRPVATTLLAGGVALLGCLLYALAFGPGAVRRNLAN